MTQHLLLSKNELKYHESTCYGSHASFLVSLRPEGPDLTSSAVINWLVNRINSERHKVEGV